MTYELKQLMDKDLAVCTVKQKDEYFTNWFIEMAEQTDYSFDECKSWLATHFKKEILEIAKWKGLI